MRDALVLISLDTAEFSSAARGEYNTAPYCTVLYFILLYCAILYYCAIIYFTVLNNTLLFNPNELYSCVKCGTTISQYLILFLDLGQDSTVL